MWLCSEAHLSGQLVSYLPIRFGSRPLRPPFGRLRFYSSTLMFWCATKMSRSEEPERWVVFISFLIGLSIGVHMLCILVIPAIVFLYFYRDHQNSTTPKWAAGLLKMVTKNEDKQKLLAASVAAIVLLGAVKSMVIPGLIAAATWFELFFVNSIGLPFNSGVTNIWINHSGINNLGSELYQKTTNPEPIRL